MKNVAIEEVKELHQAQPTVEPSKVSELDQTIKSVTIGRILRSSVAKPPATPSKQQPSASKFLPSSSKKTDRTQSAKTAGFEQSPGKRSSETPVAGGLNELERHLSAGTVPANVLPLYATVVPFYLSLQV